jgi:BirA family transcriptional regulator, biotin operon repressor / biotin---[acetyl-CoA-carboxylase] ligase
VRRFHHGTTDSTNERALASIAAGEAEHLDLHLASEQTAGRGRRGRVWSSEPGAGLYMSLVWRSAGLAPAPGLTIAAGLAVLDAVTQLGLEGAGLKWPNDLVLAGAKLAGVLVETRGLDPARPTYVIGVGLNVGQRAFPPELLAERPVTSLALAGVSTTLEDAEEALVPALRSRLESIGEVHSPLVPDYLAAAGFEGQVDATTADGTHRGRVLALDLTEGLLLGLQDGREQRLPLERLRTLVPVNPAPP